MRQLQLVISDYRLMINFKLDKIILCDMQNEFNRFIELISKTNISDNLMNKLKTFMLDFFLNFNQ